MIQPMDDSGPPERVYVESDWYDGPRSGIADFRGAPHRYVSQFDESEDAYDGTFLLQPVTAEVLALEIEQWQIFVDWYDRSEAGLATAASHPAHGGIDPRWDELEAKLASDRRIDPATAWAAKADFVWLDVPGRYHRDGPGYAVRWRLLASPDQRSKPNTP